MTGGYNSSEARGRLPHRLQRHADTLAFEARGAVISNEKAPSQSLTRSALWLLAAKIIAFAANVVLPMLVVRRLNQLEFGYYKQAFLVVASGSMLLSFGFAMTAFYFFPREQERRGAVMLNLLIFCGGMGALGGAALLVFPNLLVSLLGDQGMIRYVPLLAVLIPVWIVGTLLETAPIVNQEYKLATRLIVISQVTRTGALCLAAILYGTVAALLLAAIIHATLQTVVVLWYLESRLPGFWRQFNAGLFKAQVRYALPLGYSGLIWTFQNDLHNYFVSHNFGAAIFAIYSVGCLQIPLTGVLQEAATSVMIGRVSELQMRDDKREILALTARVARKLGGVIFAVYAYLMVMGREFLTLLFTKRYIDSWPIFAVNISLILLVPLLADPVVRCFPARLPFIVKCRSVLFVLMVLALWYFTPRFGPIAAITIAVLTNYVDRFWIVVHFAPEIGLGWKQLGEFKDTGKLALCAAAGAVPTLAVRHALLGSPALVSLLVCGLVFVAAYGIAIVLMRIPTSEEWGFVFRYVPFFKPLFANRA
jgi:O-antigen/teichoic acid export membrane protein